MLDEGREHVAGDMLEATHRAASWTGATLLSGGDSTLVCAPAGECWWLDVGAPSAAVAGSGDVKAGPLAAVAEVELGVTDRSP